jgi:hypothetical protein
LFSAVSSPALGIFSTIIHEEDSFNMVQLSFLLGLAAITQALAVPAPAPTAAPDLQKRATTCTFSGSGGYSSASKSKTSCSTIILSALAVPSGVTLDLTGLNQGTKASLKNFSCTNIVELTSVGYF